MRNALQLELSLRGSSELTPVHRIPRWHSPPAQACVCAKPGIQILCYKDTRWLGMRKQAGTRAGNHQRHTHDKLQHTNAGQQRYTSHKWQSFNQAAVHASNQDTTHTSHHTLCHQGTSHRHGSTAPAGSAHATETEALGRSLGARNQTQTPQRRRAGMEQHKTNGI